MKKKGGQLIRVQSILEGDRLSVGDSFSKLVINDLARVLNDYFDYLGEPIMKVEKCGDRLKVEFSIFASRIKTFESLPDC
jgi:hypothetical protein